MDPKQIVHSDPEIVSGTPVFVGTRVPVRSFLVYLAKGETLEEFLAGVPSTFVPIPYAQNCPTK